MIAPGSASGPRGLAACLFLSLCLFAGGCAAPSGPKEVPVEIDVSVSGGLNPDSDERPSPMVLVLYQLRAVDTFRSLDFFDVFDPEGDALRADVLVREQLTLTPGEDRVHRTELDPEAAWLGVVGAFADLEHAEWRAFVELPDRGLLQRVNVFQRDRLRIRVAERAVAFDDGE